MSKDAILGAIISIIAVMLGAVITGFVAYQVGISQEKRSWDSKRELFASAILMDMKQSVNLYEKIIHDWQKTRTVWYENTAELKEYRVTYERYMEHVLQFSPALRDKIIQYYAKTKYLILSLESSQRRKDELLKIYQTILRNLKQSQPSISEEDARKLVSKLTKNEDREFAALTQNIESKMAELAEFKIEAQDIIAQLNKEV